MKKSGIITDEEYQVLKNELLDEDQLKNQTQCLVFYFNNLPLNN